MMLEVGQVYAIGESKTLEITRIVAFGNGRTLIYWKRENGETGESSAYDLAQQLKEIGAVKIQAALEQDAAITRQEQAWDDGGIMSRGMFSRDEQE
jgi:hypothetical protein